MTPVMAFAWNPAVGIPMLVVGIIVLVLIWLFGQPRKEQQGRRKVMPPTGPAERREPKMGDEGDEPYLDDPRDPLFNTSPKQGELDVDLRAELERLGAALADERGARGCEPAHAPAPARAERIEPGFSPDYSISATDEGDIDDLTIHAPAAHVPAPAPIPAPAPTPAPAPAPAPPPKVPPRSDLGRRPSTAPVERIVSLYVVAREGARFNGSDLVVAAEKAGLEFGDMGIYHRLVDGRPELGPIFSVANLVKPGNFDMSRVATMQTPGLSFFMALPGPAPALDAWDAMLPTAQRLAELLDGLVLDEERNALGRQRIAHIRDELRGWDRGHEGEEIKFGQ
ncbi:cell division protein ZipA [Luteibacter sp. Sphag1AF]|uniref:cell division protein ZipA n=1 Tax=Luteibacter sp. Sphag1AF TaxID=2587031 RepID=UPI0017FF3D96|nr:cell division protein ZipA [Luteibacter sp. Sphag1AF]